MKLLSQQQLREWDAFTVENEPISFIDLMERAGTSCTNWISAHLSLKRPFKIFCGKGNNGGDGLVIARQLTEAGSHVDVYILEYGSKGTDAFQHNLARLHPLTTNIHFLQDHSFFPAFDEQDIVIDAILGTGINRPADGLTVSLIQHINEKARSVVSIDIPSGMFIDRSTSDHAVIEADVTLSLQRTKLPFLLRETALLAGEIQVLDIGLHPGYDPSDPLYSINDRSLIRKIFRPRSAFSHKGDHGHALLIAGSSGKTGAALLTAKATLRAGAGLVTVCSDDHTLQALNVLLPEAMTIRTDLLFDLERYTTIGIGPGLGTSTLAHSLLSSAINSEKGLVLDADALNLMAGDHSLFELLPAGSVITPHPKEFDRLFGEHTNAFERIEKALIKSSELL